MKRLEKDARASHYAHGYPCTSPPYPIRFLYLRTSSLCFAIHLLARLLDTYLNDPPTS